MVTLCLGGGTKALLDITSLNEDGTTSIITGITATSGANLIAVISGIATSGAIFEDLPALTLTPTTEEGIDNAKSLGDLVRQRDAILDDEGHHLGLESDLGRSLEERIRELTDSIGREIELASLYLIADTTMDPNDKEEFPKGGGIIRIDLTLPTDRRFE